MSIPQSEDCHTNFPVVPSRIFIDKLKKIVYENENEIISFIDRERERERESEREREQQIKL